MLTRSTPEGARDYLVPSRLQPGSWYALPQSPQLFKQLLMIGGLERYYQIARCFRDEDFRADRQPEFTQLDMELSFVEEDDVIATCDPLVRELLALADIELPDPVERISYDDALLRYGTDRPDRRVPIEIADLGEVFAESEFKVFAGALAAGGVVRGLAAPGEFPRARFDRLTERAQGMGAKGLVWGVLEADGWRSPVAKFLSQEEIDGLVAGTGAKEGDAILVVADAPAVAARVLGDLRLEVGEPEPGHDLVWIVDFPMFGRDEDNDRWDALHHPFTAPSGDLDADPGTWRSRAYDLVWNGSEIGGGSIRISTPEVQSRVFAALGLSERGGARAVRVPAGRAALRHAAPRRDRVRARPDRGAAGGQGLHPRRDRLPQGRQRGRPAHGRAGAGGRAPAAGAGPAPPARRRRPRLNSPVGAARERC